jgi:hypothetical protein
MANRRNRHHQWWRRNEENVVKGVSRNVAKIMAAAGKQAKINSWLAKIMAMMAINENML